MLLRAGARRSPRGGESEEGKKEGESRWSCSRSEAEGGEEEKEEAGGETSTNPQPPHCTCKGKISVGGQKIKLEVYGVILKFKPRLYRPEMTDCFGEFSSCWGSEDNAEIIGHQWPMPHLATNNKQTNK